MKRPFCTRRCPRLPGMLFACSAAFFLLGGCAATTIGFQYQAAASLHPVHDGAIRGSAAVGYGRSSRPVFRMRTAVSGLVAGGHYEIRLFDSPGCALEQLEGARRIDVPDAGGSQTKGTWVFRKPALTFSANMFGSSSDEFPISRPDVFSSGFYDQVIYPTVVVYAVPAGTGNPARPVACGKIRGPIERVRGPHM